MNVEQKHAELVETAERVVDDGVDFWANDRPADGTDEPVPGRKQIRTKIISDRAEYRELYDSATSEFGDIISPSMKEADFENMAGALLFLTAAGYKDKRHQSELIGDAYNQKAPEVAEFVLEIDEYSILDEYNVAQIVRLIENEDDELYQLWKREVSGTRKSVQDLNVPESSLENDDEILFLEDRLARRQEKMSQAVQEYIDGKNLPEILQELEEAILQTGEAAQTREDIVETLKSEIKDLEDQLQWAIRTQREQFVSEVETMTGKLEAELLSTEEFETELNTLEGELQWAFREHRELILEQLSSQTGEEMERLTPKEMIALLSEQRDDIVESIEQHLTQSQSQIEGRLDALTEKQRQLNQAIRSVKETREDVSQEEIKTLIESELSQLTDQRDQLASLIDRFERERERLEAEVTSLENAPTPPEPVTEGSDEIEGSDVIPADVARLYEDNFIARIERSVREASEINLSDGEVLTTGAGYWEQRSRSEQGAFQGSIVAELPEDAQIRHYPERPWTRFATVESTGLLGQSEKTNFVIEGLTLTRLSTYAEHGYDWAPATLAELHGIVGEALDRSLVRGQENAYHLLIVGSPTGWCDNVIEEVEDGVLFDADMSVCLTDLRTNEPHYYQQDSLLRHNDWLLSLNLLGERVPACVTTIEAEYVEETQCERVLLQEVVQKHGFDSHVVKLAFDRLEERGISAQIKTDRGLLLSF